MDINNLGKGCIPDIPDKNDFIIEEILGSPTLFDWEKGFDIEDKVGKIKIEAQGTSSSCVGCAWSYYLQVLEIIENKKFTDLSHKDIYSRIFQPQGGASLRDGAKIAVNRGVAKEVSNLSYEKEQPPSEAFMREIINGLEKEAEQFKSKSYATTTHNNIDFFASYIRDHHGLISGVMGDNIGWRNEFVKPPEHLDWGHALYFGKAKTINGKKYLGFCNSWGTKWGDKGWGWLGQDYFGTVNYQNVLFNLWTLIDNINNNKIMLKVLKTIDKQDNWLIVKNTRRRIPDSDTFHYFKGQLRIIEDPVIVSQTELDGYAIEEMIPSVKLTRMMKEVVSDIFKEE